MKKIFEPVKLGNLTIKNRLVRSATMEAGAARDGEITPALKEIYEGLARGGVGLIITGMMGVDRNSCFTRSMTNISHHTFEERFGEISQAIHEKDCKVVVQLSHCGVKSAVLEEGGALLGPSDFELKTGDRARAMTKEEIGQLRADFASAAKRCKEAGADGVQIHAAHGYLLSQFLSPYYNKRTDEYGGPIENRARIVLEVYQSVRQAVGEDFPVLIKINYSDLVEGGLTGEECVRVCQMLEPLGINAIEVSSGLNADRVSTPSQRPGADGLKTFAEGGLKVAAETSVSVISVGGYRTLDAMEETLNRGRLSAISLCRPLICEPDLPEKWKGGSREPAKCISCSQCFKGAFGCKTVRA